MQKSSKCKECQGEISPGYEFCRSCSQKGDRNPHWNGGRTKHSSGYMMRLSTEHPKANNKGYVYEHRFVMEEKLGRYLETHENVHHINGVKDDNRLENLELWSTNQPAGQRVSDLINWAKEIINTYGED